MSNLAESHGTTGEWKGKIFIVYSINEVGLARDLKELFEYWEFSTFYCRQDWKENRLHQDYRANLAKMLKDADLVVLLLSRGFKWSRYCQAEAGAAAITEKRVLSLMIPPATVSELDSIAPVLGGIDIMEAKCTQISGDKEWEQFHRRLKSRITTAQPAPPLNFYEQVNDEDSDPPKPSDREKRLLERVDNRIKTIVERYELEEPERIELDVWPSIQKASPARRSIVENIKASLRSQLIASELIFVGVSLKFSLGLITDALTQFADEVCSPPTSATDERPMRMAGKKLRITLVHMDDHSHILHALNDQIDIDEIRENFHVGIKKIEESWRLLCDRASLELQDLKIHPIDYIPPRVGILIDDKQFYAGTCYFVEAGKGFRLYVGEREYKYYTSAKPRGVSAIEDFRQYVSVYQKENYNGVVLMPDADRWIAHLRKCIQTYRDVTELVLISQSATKFQPLIIEGLRQGLAIKVYIQAPSKITGAAQARVSDLADRIKWDADNHISSKKGSVEIYHFTLPPTFRAVVIGQAVLGIQTYVMAHDSSHWNITFEDKEKHPPKVDPSSGNSYESIAPGPLRLIATRFCSQFKALREGMVEHFLNSQGVAKTPFARIDASDDANQDRR